MNIKFNIRNKKQDGVPNKTINTNYHSTYEIWINQKNTTTHFAILINVIIDEH